MKKVLYILFHRSVFMALALLAQIAALAIMVFSFSAYTEIFYWCCILTSVSAAVAIVGSRMGAVWPLEGQRHPPGGGRRLVHDCDVPDDVGLYRQLGRKF